MKTKVYQNLKELKLTSDETRELYATATRDKERIDVWRDRYSEVIFIDDYYVGLDEYKNGLYRKNKYQKKIENINDLNRRLSLFRQFYIGRDIIDFGCGAGDFLISVSELCKDSIGVEIEEEYIENLKNQKINVVDMISSLENERFDTFFLFQVFEHLPNPLEILKEANQKIKKKGHIIIEVPNARDFLLSELIESIEFKKHTLWSQHLILHTRESLIRFLREAGFDQVMVKGIQRYPISNHLNWLSNKKPGGHMDMFSVLDNERLHKEYENALQQIDATDTLIAYAKKT